MSQQTAPLLDDFPAVLTPKDIMDILKISKNNAYKLLNEHEIRSLRCGRKIMIPRNCLEEYLSKAQ